MQAILIKQRNINLIMNVWRVKLIKDRKFSTCAVRFYNYTTKLGAQIQ